MRGSMVDLAIGFTVGAAFTTVVKSAVNDLVMPVVGMAIGKLDRGADDRGGLTAPAGGNLEPERTVAGS